MGLMDDMELGFLTISFGDIFGVGKEEEEDKPQEEQSGEEQSGEEQSGEQNAEEEKSGNENEPDSQEEGSSNRIDQIGSDPTEAEEQGEEEPVETEAEETGTFTTEPVNPFPLPEGISLGTLGIGLALIAAAIVAVLAVLRRKKKTVVNTIPMEVPVPREELRQGAVASGARGIQVNVHQHIGAREDQQDSYGFSSMAAYGHQGFMAVVADGMGGLSNGSAVSNALVRCFVDGFRAAAGNYSNGADLLLEQAVRANNYVNQMLQGAERSGSTLVSVVIRNGYLHFLTVGDSRIYLCRGGALIQLNREHIYQEELAVKAVNQAVSLELVRKDRQAHSLTSFFGIGRIPAIDRNDEGIRLLSGDRILLASDGVFGTLSAAQMEQALRGTVTEARDAIGTMIRQADKPYQDNNTAVILEYTE